MAQRAAACGLAPEVDVAHAALSYIQRQGHLVSGAADLRVYTSQLGPEAAAWLAGELAPLLAVQPGAAEAGPERLKAVRRAVCCRQVLDDLGLPLLASPAEAVAHAGTEVARGSTSMYWYRSEKTAGLDRRGKLIFIHGKGGGALHTHAKSDYHNLFLALPCPHCGGAHKAYFFILPCSSGH